MRVPLETMPGLVPAELSTWMEDRQRDVQEALSKGDHIRVAELSAMITKGAKRMVEMIRQDISDDEFRSREPPEWVGSLLIECRNFQMPRQVWSEGYEGRRGVSPRSGVPTSEESIAMVVGK